MEADAYKSFDSERILEANARYARFVNSRAKMLGSATMDILHGAVGVAGEGGELLDAIKKCWIYGKPIDEKVIANLKEECGDAMFYIQAICNVLGCTLQELINQNIDKLCTRYPGGYSDAAALARADKQA